MPVATSSASLSGAGSSQMRESTASNGPIASPKASRVPGPSLFRSSPRSHTPPLAPVSTLGRDIPTVVDADMRGSISLNRSRSTSEVVCCSLYCLIVTDHFTIAVYRALQ